MTTLVIIGNGFDIQNGLPTSYWHFHQRYHSRLDEHFTFFPEFFDDQDWSNFEGKEFQCFYGGIVDDKIPKFTMSVLLKKT